MESTGENTTPQADTTPAPQPRGGVVRAWMELLRVPNLFTVPGDPLAGLMLAAAWMGKSLGWTDWPIMLGPVAAALCAYCAGLIHNDISDIAEDLRDRPARPLPSRRISIYAAAGAFLLFMFGGLTAAYFAGKLMLKLYCVLMVVVVLYNRYLKGIPVAGPLTMGICRGLSLLLGASLLDSKGLLCPPVMISAAGLALYIAAVTAIAARETQAAEIGLKRYLPLAFNVAWVSAAIASLLPRFEHVPLEWAFVTVISLAALASVAQSARFGWRLAGQPLPATVQKSIGLALRNLMLIQAALLFAAGLSKVWFVDGRAILSDQGICIAAGAVLMILYLGAGLVGRRFYAS